MTKDSKGTPHDALLFRKGETTHGDHRWKVRAANGDAVEAGLVPGEIYPGQAVLALLRQHPKLSIEFRG